MDRATVNSKGKILQNFVVLSEYMNFTLYNNSNVDKTVENKIYKTDYLAFSLHAITNTIFHEMQFKLSFQAF